ncbi:MAG: hypothetical protein RBR42_04155 [Desulfomicrobium sp.]|jgi:hypothetical protein|nr:hypothetical protein [Desulfomicrobium sp.]NLV96569.1 hypothetical protein [Desulfovibrionales bacterium]
MSEYRFFLLHKVLVVLVNMLVLASLTMAMYMASKDPEEFTLVFLKVFGSLLLPSLLVGVVGKRWLHRQAQFEYREETT